MHLVSAQLLDDVEKDQVEGEVVYQASLFTKCRYLQFDLAHWVCGLSTQRQYLLYYCRIRCKTIVTRVTS